MTLTPAQMADRTFATLRQMGASEPVAHLHAYHRVNANPYEGERVTYRRNVECPFCPDLPHPIGERVFTDERAFATVVGEPGPSTGWFEVEYDDGRRALMNDERVISAARAERVHGLRDEDSAKRLPKQRSPGAGEMKSAEALSRARPY